MTCRYDVGEAISDGVVFSVYSTRSYCNCGGVNSQLNCSGRSVKRMRMDFN